MLYFPTPEIWTQVKEPQKVVVMGCPYGMGIRLGARGSDGYSQATLNYQNRWVGDPPTTAGAPATPLYQVEQGRSSSPSL